jgi:hypothetical protein
MPSPSSVIRSLMLMGWSGGGLSVSWLMIQMDDRSGVAVQLHLQMSTPALCGIVLFEELRKGDSFESFREALAQGLGRVVVFRETQVAEKNALEQVGAGLLHKGSNHVVRHSRTA